MNIVSVFFMLIAVLLAVQVVSIFVLLFHTLHRHKK